MKYEDFEVGEDYLLEGDKMTLISKIRGDKEFRLRFENGNEAWTFYFQKGLSVNGFELVEPKFKVGKVYKGTLKNSEYIIFLCTKITEKALYGYGFKEGKWFDHQRKKGLYCACNSQHWEGLSEATEEEWEQSLIIEAKRRGFKEGVRVDGSIFGALWYSDSKIESDEYEYKGKNRGLDQLSIDNYAIFKRGKWVKIIKTPEVGKLYESELGTIFRCTKVEDGKVYAYGFSALGIWFDERVIKAPIEHLEDGDVDKWEDFYHKEKNKRYNIGDIVVCLDDGEEYEIESLEGSRLHPFDGDIMIVDSTCIINIILSEDGKWAEVVDTKENKDSRNIVLEYMVGGTSVLCSVGRMQRYSLNRDGVERFLTSSSTLELTLEDIAEKFEVNVDQIRIKSK